jgi:hypothetical protein
MWFVGIKQQRIIALLVIVNSFNFAGTKEQQQAT